MYCSTCGKSLNDNLNYCNGCGTRIEKNPLIVSNSATPHFAKAAGVIGLVGIVGAIFVLKLLLESRLDTSAIIVILVAYLVTVFLLFAVLVGHVWKRSGDIRIKPKEADSANSCRPITTAQLDEYREPAMSVTEHTTRTLDNVPAKDA
jgi:hypothetical protein